MTSTSKLVPTLTVRTDDTLGTISPLLHGHFAEHLGRCVYDGLWVGTGSSIPNMGGWRSDVVAALKKIGVPMLRWPGGCFADSYHWRDGIGPMESRPRTFAESCGINVVETNEAGTHEFIALCRAIGAEPYLAGNVGSGTPQELMDWVHYCNGTADTTLVRERIANGHPESMNVRYWGIGNENWGCGGNYDAAAYAVEYRRFATFVKQMDSRVQAVTCGLDPAWNRTLMEALSGKLGLVDHLSIHTYWGAGHAAEFTEEEYYYILRGDEKVERDVRTAAEMLSEVTEGKKKIGIALDEWGIWHPQARWDCDYEATSTVRDAVAAAGVFDVLHRWCADVSMANIAQIVNVLQALIQTKGADMWLTPTYYAFALYAPHQNGESLRVEWKDAPTRSQEGTGSKTWPESVFDATSAMPLVSASASRKGGALAVSVSNRHISDPIDIVLRFEGAAPSGEARLQTLVSDSPRAANSAGEQDRVTVRETSVSVGGDGAIALTLPPHSIQTLLLG